MRKSTLLLMATVAFLMLASAGCDMGQSRTRSAATRWERTLETARFEAAQESLAQGRYAFARKVLEPCMHSGRRHQEAERMMTRIQEADQMYAQLKSYRNEDTQEWAY